MPKVWMNRNTGQICLATPWWEIMPGDEAIAMKMEVICNNTSQARMKFGLLTQIGWLIQNEHDLWAGFGLATEDLFEEIGEL